MSPACQPAKKHPTEADNPVVEILYRDHNQQIARKYVFWKQEPTSELLEDWIIDYLDDVSDGYLPEGFSVAPWPFCARIYKRGNVLAEWSMPDTPRLSPAPCAESPVTAQPKAGRGGIHAVAPSTPVSTSGPRKVRNAQRTRRPIPDTTGNSAVNDAVGDRSQKSGKGQPGTGS
jgi:hypothetical protein